MSLIINGLNVSYGKNHILKDVNLSINSGEFVSVLGKSGCGKTTLIKSIAGLLDTDSGDIVFLMKMWLSFRLKNVRL